MSSKNMLLCLALFVFPLSLKGEAAAAVPVKSSHYNSNTFANLNTITNTENITFNINYDIAGDINWYKDGTLVKTDSGVNTSTITVSWTAADYGKVKEMKVNSTTVDGTSADTVWNVEVQKTGTATISKNTVYPQPRVNGNDTLYVTNGWTDLASLYLFARQADNAWIEYVKAKTYIIKKSIYIDGSTLYIDSNTARNVYIQGLPAANSNYIAKICERNNGTIAIDKVNFYGWDSTSNQELTTANGSPTIASDRDNRLDIRNSNFRHVQIHYNADKSPGDIVDNNTFFEGTNQNMWVLSADPPDGSQGQIISNNTFIYGKAINFNADRNKDISGMILRNNKFYALPGSLTTANVGLGQKASFIGNELVYSCYNMVELAAGTFSKYNNLHDNGGHHNGFNGMGTLGGLPDKYTYFVNDYCHDFPGYSGWYVNVVTYSLPDPADWDIADHAYVINGYAKDASAGLGLLGLYDSYFYNYNSDSSGNVIQYGTDHLVFRKSHFFNSSQTALMMQDVNPKSGYGYVENIYVIDSEFSYTNTDDYRLWSDPVDGGNPIVHSVNSYRRNSDNSIRIPAVNIMGSGWNGEVRNYAYLDVLVQDRNGSPIPNAAVTIEALTDPSLPAVKVDLPPPPDNLDEFPQEALPIPDVQNFDSINTGTNGHTPPPNYGWSTGTEATPALIFTKQTRGSSIITTRNYSYRITATYNSQIVHKDIVPDAAWLREDPAQASRTVVLTFDKPAGKYALNVNGGAGSGLYDQGQSVNIAAGAAPSGKVFDKWIGDTTTVNNVNSASTFIVVPSSDVSVTAYYKDITYHLTVVGGTGSGDYPAGKITVVDASTSSATQVFYKWTGDTDHVVSPAVYSSTLIMPAHDVTVTATYRDPVSYNCHLTVADGQGTDFYAPGDNVSVSAPESPFSDMLFDRWEGDTANLADVGSCNTTLTDMPASYLIIYPVYRASGLPSNNAYLSGLAVSSGTLSPVFMSGTAGYTVRVGTCVTSMTVTPTASKGASAAITVNGIPVNSGSASGAIILNNSGSTVITIIVTAPDTTTAKTYTVTVIRANATAATGYTLTAPSPAGGVVNATSGNFTVTPNGIYTGTITITPSGGGLSAAIKLNFANSSAARTFTITPTAAGTVTLTPGNNGGLADPAAVTYTAYMPGTLRNACRNYPNPAYFSKVSRTTIAYTVASESAVTIRIYTITGELVKTLVNNETRAAGEYTVDWQGDTESGRKAASGVYFCIASIGKDIIKKKIAIIR